MENDLTHHGRDAIQCGPERGIGIGVMEFIDGSEGIVRFAAFAPFLALLAI